MWGQPDVCSASCLRAPALGPLAERWRRCDPGASCLLFLCPPSRLAVVSVDYRCVSGLMHPAVTKPVAYWPSSVRPGAALRRWITGPLNIRLPPALTCAAIFCPFLVWHVRLPLATRPQSLFRCTEGSFKLDWLPARRVECPTTQLAGLDVIVRHVKCYWIGFLQLRFVPALRHACAAAHVLLLGPLRRPAAHALPQRDRGSRQHLSAPT